MVVDGCLVERPRRIGGLDEVRDHGRQSGFGFGLEVGLVPVQDLACLLHLDVADVLVRGHLVGRQPKVPARGETVASCRRGSRRLWHRQSVACLLVVLETSKVGLDLAGLPFERLDCVQHRRELARKLGELRLQTVDESIVLGQLGKNLGQNAIEVLVDLHVLALALFSLCGCSGRVIGPDFAELAHVLRDLVCRIRDVDLRQDRDNVGSNDLDGSSSEMKS